MSRTFRIESSTDIYHVMQRGVGKQIVFEDDADCRFYLNRLFELKNEMNFEILAYCLMYNHTHLLIKADKETLSSMMQRLGTSYAMYFNVKYERVGHLFQGRFLSQVVQDDKYLRTCIRYIHNNPVAAGISTLEMYPWSSYNEYLIDKGICERKYLYSCIGGRDSFAEFSKVADDTQVLDIDSGLLTYESGIDTIKELCGLKKEDGLVDGSIVKMLSKQDRDRVLRGLKKKGYTARQIERITGICKNIVYKA